MHVFKKWSHKKEISFCINLENLDGMLQFIELQSQTPLGDWTTSTKHLYTSIGTENILISPEKSLSLPLSLPLSPSYTHIHLLLELLYKCLVSYKYLLMYCTTILKVPRASMAGTETKTK